MNSEPLLSYRVSAEYRGKGAVLRDVQFEIGQGEIVGLVGRSGEGKSTIASSILGLLPLKGGKCTGWIHFQGRDLLSLRDGEMRRVRGKAIGFVPQSPLAALNPNLRLRAQLDEAWRAHQEGSPDWKPLLQSVSLPDEVSFLRQYPRSLSVGLAQRFQIALAILHRPALLLADEPTSALDSVTQGEILSLFANLNRRYGIAILYISHDLASVASLCHRVAILHQGTIVECGLAEEIFARPQHEYTRRLIAAIPNVPGPSNLDAGGPSSDESRARGILAEHGV